MCIFFSGYALYIIDYLIYKPNIFEQLFSMTEGWDNLSVFLEDLYENNGSLYYI